MAITWVVVLAVASSILVSLGVYAWRHRTVPGALSFSLLMFAIAGYALTYALELLGRDLPTKMLWIRAEYPFIVAIPVLWLIFALQYTGKGQWLSRRNTILLSIVPSVTVLTVWTNQAHHLYYHFTGIQEIGSWMLLHVEYGPWFWVHITFSYLCLLAGTLLLADAFFRATPLYRRQAAVLLLGALIPWLGNVLYLTRVSPWPDLDLTPLAFTLSGLVTAYGLFRYRLLQIVPVARRAVVDGMPTAMIVLDAEGRIADLNPAARRLFNLTDKEAIGQPARQVLKPSELVTRFAGVAQADAEVEWGEGGERQVYQVTISPLDDGSADIPPRLVLVSDVTEQVQAREALEQANRRLRALQESTAALTALLGLDQVLGAIMEHLGQVVDHEGATVTLLHDDGLECVAAWGFADPAPLAAFDLHIGDNAIFQEMVATGAPVILADVSQDPRWEWVAGVEFTRAWIGAPLKVKGRIIGQLSVYHSRPGCYGAEDGQTLLAFARQAAVTIENARLHEEANARAEALARQNRHLALLHEIARVAASTLDLPTLYQALADTLAQIIGGDGCYITRIDETSGQVLGGAAYGPFRESYLGLRPPPGKRTLTESVLKAGRPLAVEDVFHSPYLSPRIAEMFPARSQLGLPLRVGERDLGAVLIAFNQPHKFSDEEITWATQAVDLAALALENARLFQIVEQGKREWEATFDAMPDLIAILDQEYRIVRANKAMADKLSVAPAGAVGLTCYECVHGTQQPPSFCPHVRLLADGQEHTAEVREEHLGGDFLVSVSPIHDADGRLRGSVHVARDITERKRAEEEREQLILELQDALAKVKTLSGLLPICANCKKIRDDQGYWHSVEAYVRDHSDAEFSHGICPDCHSKLYPPEKYPFLYTDDE